MSAYWEKELTIRRVARKIRKKTERFAEKRGFRHDLYGLCSDASRALRLTLWRYGIRPNIAFGSFIDEEGKNRGWHCWLEWRGFIIDITATQFEIEKKVYICKEDKRYRKKKNPSRLFQRHMQRSSNITKLILATSGNIYPKKLDKFGEFC